MLIRTTCPTCGAQLDVDVNGTAFFCMNCGARLNIAAGNTVNGPQYGSQTINNSGAIGQETNASLNPNFIVEYTTAERYQPLKVTFDGQEAVLMNGTSREFCLPLGKTVVNFKIRKSWNRNIFIGQNHPPVRAQVVVGHSVKIYIEQPQQAVDEYKANEHQLEINRIEAVSHEKEDRKAAKAMRKEEKQRAKELKRLNKG